MDHGQHNTIVSFIWGIADDVLRDDYVRGKYRDVTPSMLMMRTTESRGSLRAAPLDRGFTATAIGR